MLKIAFVFGTRPEFIKLAPVIRAMHESETFDPVCIHSGQHSDLGFEIPELFGFEPDIILTTMRENQTLASLSSKLFDEIPPLLNEISPDYVMVQGDTTTALCAAQCAFYMGFRVLHVEAGLRSFDKMHPFPEELNRVMISRLTDIHFAPTESAAKNLKAEGVDPNSIIITGNTVVDALNFIVEKHPDKSKAIRNRYLTDASQKLILLTSHRRENFGLPQRMIFKTICEIAEKHPELVFVYPVHPNPAIKNSLQTIEGLENIHLIEPRPYLDFISMIRAADLILTDSGGIQEEAPVLGKPVIVLREKTERPELIEAGAGVLTGSDPEKIKVEFQRFLNGEFITSSGSLFGDGFATKRILASLIK